MIIAGYCSSLSHVEDAIPDCLTTMDDKFENLDIQNMDFDKRCP